MIHIFCILLLFIDALKTVSIAIRIDNKYFVAQSFLKGTIVQILKIKIKKLKNIK